MSQITVAQVKAFLRVFGTADDDLLQDLIDGAEDEACRFLNRTNLPTLPLEYPAESSSDAPYSEETPSSEDPVAPSVRMAIYYWVQAKYEALKPEDVTKMRQAGETLLQPFRNQMGV